MDTRKQYLATHASNGDLMSMHNHLIAWYILRGYLEPVVNDYGLYSGLALTNTGQAWLYHAPAREPQAGSLVTDKPGTFIAVKGDYQIWKHDNRFQVYLDDELKTTASLFETALDWAGWQYAPPQPATVASTPDSGTPDQMEFAQSRIDILTKQVAALTAENNRLQESIGHLGKTIDEAGYYLGQADDRDENSNRAYSILKGYSVTD